MNDRKYELRSSDIAKQWYQYAQNIGTDDVYFRFMIAWMAFNYLYSEISIGSKIGDVVIDAEAKQIKAYIKLHRPVLSRFNAFETKWIEPYMEAKVTSKRLKDYLSERNWSDIQQRRIDGLLLSIYTVRCNLFHGNKSPEIERDYRLVEAGWHIVEGYLKELLRGEEEQRL